MFHPIYTDKNNEATNPTQLQDPLNLKRCMRLYPQDDNQGGFFVCTLEKSDNTDGQIDDETDPWLNPKIRQKPILEELAEFSKWYEQIYKEHCDKNNIPEEFRKVLEMSKMVEEA